MELVVPVVVSDVRLHIVLYRAQRLHIVRPTEKRIVDVVTRPEDGFEDLP